MSEVNYVRAFYKTGVYIAELLESQEDRQRALVKVLAVLKHPTQGDLHNPKQVDVPYFHQRKALAQYEKTWVPFSSLKGYEGDVPDYKLSLCLATEKLGDALREEGSEWAQRSLEKLEECINEYQL